MTVLNKLKFDQLIKIESESGFIYQDDNSRVVFAPDLGARVFCELNGICLHRLDIENIKIRNKPFNNYGGNNFWPAPEGGMFGFNYNGNEWYVQPAINEQPFVLNSKSNNDALATKETTLKNRCGTELDVTLTRKLQILPQDDLLFHYGPAQILTYSISDGIVVKNNVSKNDALISCWTLEQFDATSETVSFCKVSNPNKAINFDFYDDPSNQIEYLQKGFFYKTDGIQMGQIGIKRDAKADFIGFYDLDRKLLCTREIMNLPNGIYFNIADNDQIEGSFSAADNYSIYNGDKSFGAFELETIAGMETRENIITGSHLVSKTCFGIFDRIEPIIVFLQNELGLGNGV